MAEYKVTREMVQELAELGALQLPRETIPPYDSFMRDILASKDSALKFSVKNAPDYLLWIILREIVQIESGGTDNIECAYIEAHANRRKIPSQYIHQDRFDQKLSCVWMQAVSDKVPPTEDKLYVYGRGERASQRPTAQFSYSQGPIVLAGFNFGKNLVAKSIDTDYVWHEGKGEPDGHPFFAADIYTNSTKLV